MRPIAEWLIARFLAPAPGHFFDGVDIGNDRAHAGVLPFVGPVTKRLFFRLTAGAPMVFPGLHLHHEWRVLFCAHNALLVSVILRFIAGLPFDITAHAWFLLLVDGVA